MEKNGKKKMLEKNSEGDDLNFFWKNKAQLMHGVYLKITKVYGNNL